MHYENQNNYTRKDTQKEREKITYTTAFPLDVDMGILSLTKIYQSFRIVDISSCYICELSTMRINNISVTTVLVPPIVKQRYIHLLFCDALNELIMCTSQTFIFFHRKAKKP